MPVRRLIYGKVRLPDGRIVQGKPIFDPREPVDAAPVVPGKKIVTRKSKRKGR